MTITQLKYVLAVAEHRNFTKAARKSFVTQPTLSMQIQKLEEELNILIFDRKSKPLRLTDLGEKIIEQAKKIVSEAERIQDIVEQEKGFIGGEFRLGIIPTVTSTLLPMFLMTFNKKYPKVQLKIEEINTREIIEQLESGKIDAAIAATPLEHPDLRERPIYYEPFVGYAPDHHRLSGSSRLTIEDLSLDDMLLLEDGHCFRDGVINLCKNGNLSGKGDYFKIKSGSFETLIKLSNEGLGMTLLPYLHTLELRESEKKHLRYFEDPPPAREISIVQHNNQLKNHIVNALYEVISSVIRGAIVFQDVKIISPLARKSS